MKTKTATLEKCELCNRKGVINRKGLHFCDKEHEKLHDKKWKDAEKRMKTLTKCSICGKPIGKSKWTMVDCRIKRISDKFTPHRFCSEGCWEKWGAYTVHPLVEELGRLIKNDPQKTVKLLKSRDEQKRQFAAASFRWSIWVLMDEMPEKIKAIIPDFISALKSPDEYVRWRAICILSDIKEEKPELLKGFNLKLDEAKI